MIFPSVSNDDVQAQRHDSLRQSLRHAGTVTVDGSSLAGLGIFLEAGYVRGSVCG